MDFDNFLGTSALSPQPKSWRERYAEVARKIQMYGGKRAAYEEMRKNYENRIQRLRDHLQKVQEEAYIQKETVDAITEILRDINETSKESVAATLNKALKSLIRDGRYTIKILDDRHGAHGLTTHIEIEDRELRDTIHPRFCNGEAVKQTISFILIFSFIALSGKRRLLVLDESLGGVYEESAEEIGGILQQLARDNNFQLVLVNQNSNMYSVEGAKIIRLDLESVQEGLKIVEEYIVGAEPNPTA